MHVLYMWVLINSFCRWYLYLRIYKMHTIWHGSFSSLFLLYRIFKYIHRDVYSCNTIYGKTLAKTVWKDTIQNFNSVTGKVKKLRERIMESVFIQCAFIFYIFLIFQLRILTLIVKILNFKSDKVEVQKWLIFSKSTNTLLRKIKMDVYSHIMFHLDFLNIS